MKMKKILVTILALGTVFCTSNNVLACSEEVNSVMAAAKTEYTIMRYAHILNFNPSITSSGRIRVGLTLRDSFDYSMTLELQEYDGTWESIDTWTLDGTEAGSISETCSLESGKKYRAKATVEVYDGSGRVVESTTKYSTSITAR